MGQWWAVTVMADRVVAGTEVEEVLGWQLSELCSGRYLTRSRAQGFELQGWLDGDTPVEVLDVFRKRIESFAPAATVRWEQHADSDWERLWKEHLQPRQVGSFLILPEWFEPPPNPGGRLVIRTNPGMAFGTGEHETTRLCLLALDRLVRPGTRFADIGCGSGILTVAGLKLGAASGWAADVDPIAAKATVEHLALNHLTGRVEVCTGSADLLTEPVDGIVSNILAEVIAELAPEFGRLALPGAWGIFSGLLISQVETVEASLTAVGWQRSDLLTERDWACVIGHW